MGSSQMRTLSPKPLVQPRTLKTFKRVHPFGLHLIDSRPVFKALNPEALRPVCGLGFRAQGPVFGSEFPDRVIHRNTLIQGGV